MSVPNKLRWHSYGAVDVALHAEDRRPDNDYCCGNGPPEPEYVVYAKYTQPISRPGTPAEYDERVFRAQDAYDNRDPETGDPDTYWENAETGKRVPVGSPRNLEEVEQEAPIHLFNAATTLLWHDFECFQVADAAMGDSCP